MTLRRKHLLIAIEFLLILLPALFVTREWWEWDENTILPGNEAEWLTSAAFVAHDSLAEMGRIARWNPYNNWGEPLVENAFSFVLNPFSILPSLVVGGVQGIKWSSAFYLVFAAFGGWYCGKALGLNWVGRVLLAWLLLFKGNQHMMIRAGYFQLGVQQAYFGWIIGGAFEVLTTRRRTPIVLTAVMIVLMFWAGNVWYILPILITLAVMTSVLVVRRSDIHWMAIRRMSYAAVLTLVLGAAYILPVVLQQSSIGRHPPEIRAGWELVNPLHAGLLYVDGSLQATRRDLIVYKPNMDSYVDGWLFIYYSYVAPLSVVGSFVVVFFYYYHRKHTVERKPFLPQPPYFWRMMVIGGVLIVLITMWGMGGTGLFIWLYEHVPLLDGWRFVGRALAMSSFWVAVIIAMFAHGIWNNYGQWYMRGLLLIGCGLILADQMSYWNYTPMVIPRERTYENCLNDFREEYGDAPLAMEYPGYNVMRAFINEKVRHLYIDADFVMLPQDNTLGRRDHTLAWLRPPYLLSHNATFANMVLDEGLYTPYVIAKTKHYPHQPTCIWQYKENSLPYAFTLSKRWHQSYRNSTIEEWIDAPYVTEVTSLQRHYDTIAVLTHARRNQEYLVVSENASYGWHVTVDGNAVPLEVIAGVIAVKLPLDGQQHFVVFEYRSTLYTIGAILTIIGAVGSIVFLLWRKKNTISVA